MLYLLLSQIPCIWLAQHDLLHLPLVDYQLMVCFFYNFLRHSTQWGLFTLVIVNIELLHGEWTGVHDALTSGCPGVYLAGGIHLLWL